METDYEVAISRAIDCGDYTEAKVLAAEAQRALTSARRECAETVAELHADRTLRGNPDPMFAVGSIGTLLRR